MEYTWSTFAITLAFSMYCCQASDNHPLINQQILDDIAYSGARWQTTDVQDNMFANMKEDDINSLMGTILDKVESKERDLETVAGAAMSDTIAFPREFDAREAFPHCQHPIRNQLKCGSCWAFSVGETWADNACVLGLVPQTTIFSIEDILSCATFGSGQCGGGRINYAFDYVVSDGLVAEQCMPYTSQNGSVGVCPSEVGPNERTCLSEGVVWNATACTSGSPNDLFTTALMKEGIMKLGAIAAGYDVFQDFMSYKGGIYKHVTGPHIGGHAIKVVGWGVQNATANSTEEQYWIVANSWGPKWGEEGYFRFSFNDTDCAFGQGGAYNCGMKIPESPRL